MTIRIICINKDNGNHMNPYEAITHFEWTEDNTKKNGRSTLQEMITFIEGGGKAYVKDRRENISYLEVRTSTFGGNKYVRTIPDNTSSNNLLELDECLR